MGADFSIPDFGIGDFLDAISATFSAIPQIIQTIATAFPKIMNDLLGAVTGLSGQLEGVLGSVTGIFGSVTSLIDDTIKRGGSLLDAVTAVFTEIPNLIKGIGDALLELFKGVGSIFSAVAESIRGLLDSVIESVRQIVNVEKTIVLFLPLVILFAIILGQSFIAQKFIAPL
jgi:phage-related protein